MRVQLKHILPATLLLSGVLAASTQDSTDKGTAAAETGATATGDSSATATDDSSNATTDAAESTATGDSTATGSDSNSGDSKKTTAKSSKTSQVVATNTFTAKIQSTTAPDLEGGAFSFRDNNYIIVTLSISGLAALSLM